MSQFENIKPKTNVKEKIRKAVAIGVATVAFGGAGEAGFNAKEVLANDSAKTKGNISSVEHTKSKEKIEKLEKELLEKYKKAQKSVDDLNQKVFLEKDPKYNAEKVRNELKKHISSQDYFDKLIIEFGGDVEKAKNIQKERLKYLDTVGLNFLKDVNGTLLLFGNINVPIPKWLANVRNYILDLDGAAGFYDPIWHNIALPDEKDNDTTRHEMLHASTRGDFKISRAAEEKFKDSYRKIGKSDRYYSDISERLVRKQQLDLEMQRLKIKKYGEKFTDEHFNKLMKFYKENKLSQDACEFIKTTKPEYFKKIFNKIAKNENGESQKIEQV